MEKKSALLQGESELVYNDELCAENEQIAFSFSQQHFRTLQRQNQQLQHQQQQAPLDSGENLSVIDFSQAQDYSLLSLPDEVFLMVLSQIDYRSILATLCTCSEIYASTEYYFKRIVKHIYGKRCTLQFQGVSWRWLFQSKTFISEDKLQNFTGVGKKKLYQNDSYEGEFDCGMCSGYGTYYWSRGDRYVGQWKNGLQDGYGILYWKGGNKYEGGWSKGLRHGNGIYSWEVSGFNFEPGNEDGEGGSRDIFEGTWVNGVRHGEGKYVWANGNVCEGYWQADTRAGGHFFEKLSGRRFYAPNVDSEGAEVNLDILHPVIKESFDKSRCTYLGTGKQYYFQYLWETTHKMPFNGVCITCKNICVPRNQIQLSVPVKFIFGGKFICPCGAGYFQHPCRAMGFYDPEVDYKCEQIR